MKRIHIFFSIVFLSGILLFTSCKKFDYFQTDPNHPTQADPALELNNIEQSAFSNISADADLASRYLAYTQSTSLTQYYGWQRNSFDYTALTQVVKMEQEGDRVGKPNYRYLGKFFRSYYIVGMTQVFGDIPYSQALQTIENNNLDSSATQPAYDKQEDIYLQVLNDLKIAADSLSDDGGAINGDIIYDGDVTKWKMLINSFSLRVLMSLSLHESDAKLNIKQRFNDIYSNANAYPLFTSNDDNGELQYYNITGNQYPYYNSNSLKTDYYLDSSFVKILKDLKDPRLFVFGNPMPSASNLPANDFNAYGGLDGSAPLADNIQKKTAGNASPINDRYAYEPINEPSLLMGYAELQFLLAEAVERGWISGNAQTFYNNGIEASLNFSNFNSTYSDGDIQAYVAQPSVALQAGKEIQQIITQKYISSFMQTSWQPFFEQRRTGYPVFITNGGGVLNNQKIPKRWMYPSDEYSNNAINVEDAVSSQYPNGDDINGVMWLIQ